MTMPAHNPLTRSDGSGRWFIAAVAAGGALILTMSVEAALRTPASAGWLVLAVIGVASGHLTMKLPGIETRFSLSDAVVITSLIMFGPERTALVAAVEAVAASRFSRGTRGFSSRVLFNVAAATVTVYVSGHVFRAVLGDAALTAGALQPWRLVLATAAMVACYSCLSTAAVTMVLALTRQRQFADVWRQNFAWVWVAHAWSGLVALVIAVYAPQVTVLSLLIIAAVTAVGYATVRVYLRKAEESTTHLQKLNELYLATIKALAMAIDAKDQVTHGHIRRVQIYTVGLARALGVTDELSLKGIEAGALLHDTGKIAIPEHILNKPGKLTAQEYERMKTHVTIGAEILSGIQFPYPVIPFVRHHHENWDGTGYPDRLRGEEIPLGARILSVVDCFDALTSDRPYRKALSVDAALAILQERAGTMYDSRVVAKFIEVLPQLTATLAADEHLAAAAPDLGLQTADEPAAPEPVTAPALEALPELDDLARLARAGLRPEEAAFLVTNRLKPRLRFAACAVYVARAADDTLDAIHVAGRHVELFRHSRIRLAEGLSGWAAAHRQTVINGNPALDLHGPAASSDIQLASALVVPLAGDQASRGALAFYATAPDAFTLAHARLAAAAAVHLSRALHATPDRIGAATMAEAKQCA